MLQKLWTAVTHDGTARGLSLIVAVLVALGGAFAYFKPANPGPTPTTRAGANSDHASQSTTGANSPIINGNSGPVIYSATPAPSASPASGASGVKGR